MARDLDAPALGHHLRHRPRMGDRFDRRALVAEVDELSRLLVSGAPQRQLAKRVDVLRRILNGEGVGVVAAARRSAAHPEGSDLP